MSYLLNVSDISSMTQQTGVVESLLAQARQFTEQSPSEWPLLLQHRVVALLFFEASTRTKCSFELAAKNLGATVLNVDLQHSSLAKGETELDTIKNLEAMGVDIFVIRHQEDDFCQRLIPHLLPKTALLNAGTGRCDHPSQALLDAFTIMQYKQNISDLSIAIAGDIKHSRVAHSNVELLCYLGCRDIRLIAPNEFQRSYDTLSMTKTFTSLQEGVCDADVMMMLRIQKERFLKTETLDFDRYCASYQLTNEHLQYAKPDAIVMHPGPMNREVEIQSAVADGPQSVILQQTRYGVLIRMALLAAV